LGTPLAVEGQTRFLVNELNKIEKLVVTRTFSDWELKAAASTLLSVHASEDDTCVSENMIGKEKGGQ
jgi:hypothetical protein